MKGNCYICKKEMKLIEHHISYLPQIVIRVCQGCHNKIHLGKLNQYCSFSRRQKLIFYKHKNHLEFRKCSQGIRVPMTKEEKQRFPGSSGYKYFYMRPMTEKELWINKEMKKNKVVLE